MTALTPGGVGSLGGGISTAGRLLIMKKDTSAPPSKIAVIFKIVFFMLVPYLSFE